jgi:NAD(P)-dependent dehydrogenase (short-subunit alcohol dehydrogenase family)
VHWSNQLSGKPVVIVAGAGGAFGSALMDQLNASGYLAVGIRRPKPALNERSIVSQHYLACDLIDEIAIAKLKRSISEKYGTVHAVIYNAHQFLIESFANTTPKQFEDVWRTDVLGAFLMAQAFVPMMLENKQGTVIFTGATASVRGSANFAAFASAKFALRGLAQTLSREYAPLGIHVAHIVIDGLVWGDNARDLHKVSRDKCIEPEHLAKVYVNLLEQDKSIWTHELDIRPYSGKF